MEHITRGLKPDNMIEKKENVIGNKNKISINDIDKEYEKAIKIQEEISDCLIRNNADMKMAYTVCIAMAESILHYMMFGDTEI